MFIFDALALMGASLFKLQGKRRRSPEIKQPSEDITHGMREQGEKEPVYMEIDFRKTYLLWKTMKEAGNYKGGGRITRHDAHVLVSRCC